MRFIHNWPTLNIEPRWSPKMFDSSEIPVDFGPSDTLTSGSNLMESPYRPVTLTVKSSPPTIPLLPPPLPPKNSYMQADSSMNALDHSLAQLGSPFLLVTGTSHLSRSVAARCQWKSAASDHFWAAATATGRGCSAGSSCLLRAACDIEQHNIEVHSERDHWLLMFAPIRRVILTNRELHPRNTKM